MPKTFAEAMCAFRAAAAPADRRAIAFANASAADAAPEGAEASLVMQVVEDSTMSIERLRADAAPAYVAHPAPIVGDTVLPSVPIRYVTREELEQMFNGDSRA